MRTVDAAVRDRHMAQGNVRPDHTVLADIGVSLEDASRAYPGTGTDPDGWLDADGVRLLKDHTV